ncbi:ThiF family adenylyltransferase [Thiocapsa imhoffii]|nr:ThiF family adenylyltransferase [Thiocapsa imhoffii]
MDAIRLRFPQGLFAALREQLLADTERESFALLFGQRHRINTRTMVKIVDVCHPRPEDYESRGLAHLHLRREYVYDRLVEMQRRGDVDTLIDVHTHPFSERGAAFSVVDDRDEVLFHQWLNDTLDGIHYASIVLSRGDYSARLWEYEDGRPRARSARIKTQTILERWPCLEDLDDPALLPAALEPEQGFLARSTLALGLDVLRHIVRDQCVAVVGVGGLGSAIAENLVHSGFHHLHLIDHDHVEMTNLNRIVGAYASDAKQCRLKVEVVAEHLRRINPEARIETHPVMIEDERLLPALVESDWILLSTDSHSSRYATQTLALRFGIPLIAAGSNISVEEGRMTDMSGEVILARQGDRLCLNCLGRVAPTQIAAETVGGLGEVLERRGYVSGRAVKEPAVKTLNALIAALAVETLINQYTGRPTVPILVYEGHALPRLYPDTDSVTQRRKDCFHCA